MKRARTSSVLSERIWAIVKAVKLMLMLRGEKTTSPVMARELVLAARHGPSSCAAAERTKAKTAARAARSSERERID